MAVFTTGLAAIALGVDPSSEKLTPLLFLAGLVAVVVATVLLASPSLRVVSRFAGRLPVAAWLATRDLARYQSRSAAALGVISLAIGMAVAVVATSEVVPLDVAVDSKLRDVQDGRTVLPIALLGRPAGQETLRDSGRLFVATPALWRHLSLDRSAAPDDHVLLTSLPGPAYITGDISNVSFRRNAVPADQVARSQVPSYTSAPRSLITQRGLDDAHLDPMRAGWLLETPSSPSDAELARVRAIAADAGLVIEVRDQRSDLTTISTTAAIAGALVALAILAMTIGLLRSDAEHQTRILPRPERPAEPDVPSPPSPR